MEHVVPIIVGLFAMTGTIVSAFILHNKNKNTLELKLDHQTEVLDKQIGHLGETIELKLKNLDAKVDSVSKKVGCVETKVDANIEEVGKVKTKVMSLEKDVETLKKGGVKFAKT